MKELLRTSNARWMRIKNDYCEYLLNGREHFVNMDCHVRQSVVQRLATRLRKDFEKDWMNGASVAGHNCKMRSSNVCWRMRQ